MEDVSQYNKVMQETNIKLEYVYERSNDVLN